MDVMDVFLRNIGSLFNCSVNPAHFLTFLSRITISISMCNNIFVVKYSPFMSLTKSTKQIIRSCVNVDLF